jgi:hypothetical protein
VLAGALGIGVLDRHRQGVELVDQRVRQRLDAVRAGEQGQLVH